MFDILSESQVSQINISQRFAWLWGISTTFFGSSYSKNSRINTNIYRMHKPKLCFLFSTDHHQANKSSTQTLLALFVLFVMINSLTDQKNNLFNTKKVIQSVHTAQPSATFLMTRWIFSLALQTHLTCSQPTFSRIGQNVVRWSSYFASKIGIWLTLQLCQVLWVSFLRTGDKLKFTTEAHCHCTSDSRQHVPNTTWNNPTFYYTIQYIFPHTSLQ